jgi:hypothetical protein
LLAKAREAVSRTDSNGEVFEYLHGHLDDLCCEIAEKYGLFDSHGRPRKAFVLDTLIKYACRGCIVKVLAQLRKANSVDKLFLQNHRLAVNLLVEQLRNRLAVEGLTGKVEEEVNCVYGRPDIILKLTNAGVIIQVGDVLEIIVEVKTGDGFTYAQLFRYLIERPNAILILWRVARRQNIVIKGTEVRSLLIMVMEAALKRGKDILSDGYEDCSHNPVGDKPYVVEDAQAIVDNLLPSLPMTIQSVVDVILSIIESQLGKVHNRGRLATVG